MPLYEWRCPRCDLTFEALVAFGASKRKRECPECGRPSARLMPAPVFHTGQAQAPVHTRAAGGRPDVTQLRVPAAARLCWMDDKSAARLAAYRHGRGAEYDDTIAARSEARKKYGMAEKQAPARASLHAHSPLADPAVFARRAAAARKSPGKKRPRP